jgi:hypothetical protein
MVSRKMHCVAQIAVLAAEAWRETYPEWPDRLYQAAQPAKCSRVRIKAIPYCFWDNRAAGEMLVWIRRLYRLGEKRTGRQQLNQQQACSSTVQTAPVPPRHW